MTDNKVVKAVVKRAITRLENKVNEYEREVPDNVVVDLQIEKARQLANDCVKLLTLIPRTEGNENLETEEADIGDMEDRIDIILCKLYKCRSPVTQNVNNMTGAQVSQPNQVQLPRLQLPVFSGIGKDWIPFQDLFIASVCKNEQLSKAQKLQYLKASLKGEPLTLISAIPVTDDNFQIA